MRTGSFHDTLRAAIRARGLTLDRVRSRLADRGRPVGLSTLSGWQHGHTRPASLEIVYALEEILGLPRGALVELIPRNDLSERIGALGELLDSFPGARDHDVDLICQHHKVSIDASGCCSQIWSRILLRARRDGVDRMVMRYFADAGADPRRIVIEAAENCRLGQVRLHPDRPVLVAEILFGQKLRAGDSWVFERRIGNPAGQPSTAHAYAARHRVEQYLLQMRFHPSMRPIDCHTFTQPALYEPRRRTAELSLDTHHGVHLLGAPPVTGVVGIGRRWPT